MSSYKFSLLVLLVFASENLIQADYVETWKSNVVKMLESCKDEVGATQEDLDEMLKTQNAISHAAKCISFCAQKRIGVQREDGSLNIEAAISSIDDMEKNAPEMYKMIRTAQDTCFKNKFTGDPCDIANDIQSCHKAEIAKVGKKFFFGIAV